jgi:hypothetical protein
MATLQTDGGITLNLAALGAVAGVVATALSFLFRALLTAKDAQISDCVEWRKVAEASLVTERERRDRDVAAERAKTEAVLRELHDALAVVGQSVGHAERAVEAVNSHTRGRG